MPSSSYLLNPEKSNQQLRVSCQGCTPLVREVTNAVIVVIGSITDTEVEAKSKQNINLRSIKHSHLNDNQSTFVSIQRDPHVVAFNIID